MLLNQLNKSMSINSVDIRQKVILLNVLKHGFRKLMNTESYICSQNFNYLFIKISMKKLFKILNNIMKLNYHNNKTNNLNKIIVKIVIALI